MTTETRTEADMLGAAMAKVTGRQVSALEARIKALEFRLDVAAQPHTIGCTQLWDTCTCGLRAVMEESSPTAMRGAADKMGEAIG